MKFRHLRIGQLGFIRWLRTGGSLPILGKPDGPVAGKSAVKRDKQTVRFRSEHADLYMISMVPLA